MDFEESGNADGQEEGDEEEGDESYKDLVMSQNRKKKKSGGFQAMGKYLEFRIDDKIILNSNLTPISLNLCISRF